MNSATLRQALAGVVGPGAVALSRAERMQVSRGTWPVEFKRAQLGDWSQLPAAVVRPASAEQVAALFRVARRVGLPLVPYGGGSGIVGGSSLPGAILVDLKRLDGLELDETNQTVTAGAGLLGAHLEEQLNQWGYTGGHYPQSLHSSTVGGWVATAAVGTFSGRYGKLDDLLVALEVALPSGRLLRTPPVPRRSAGPNLNHLFLGAEGALGIVTRATLQVWPLPEDRRWLAYTFPDTPRGLEAVRALVQGGIDPALVRLYDEAEAEARLARFGYPLGQALLLLACEGPRGLVAWQVEAAQALCQARGGQERGPEPALDWYGSRFDTTGLLRYNRRPGGLADALEVAAPWSRLEGVWRAMREALLPLADTVHAHFSHVYRWGGSVYVIFYAEVPGGPRAAIDHYRRCVEAAMQACLEAGGSIAHHHGVGRGRAGWMPVEHGLVGFELLQALKQALDPEQLLNPSALGLGEA